MINIPNEEDWFTVEPDDEFVISMLCDYKPTRVEELTEWLLIAARGVLDKDGKRAFYRMPPYVAWQIARMMQIARLEVPSEEHLK